MFVFSPSTVEGIGTRGNKKEQTAHELRAMSGTLSGILAEGLQLLIRAAGGGAEHELFAAAFLGGTAAIAGFMRSQIVQLESNVPYKYLFW